MRRQFYEKKYILRISLFLNFHYNNYMIELTDILLDGDDAYEY